ncbi:NAD(P)-binding domain-containing protein, partial [Inquilinus limosus]
MAEKTRIGVVGLGSMGAAMAGRLLDQGWPV